MDIRFKSKPKVSTVNILDDSKFQIKEFDGATDSIPQTLNGNYFPVNDLGSMLNTGPNLSSQFPKTQPNLPQATVMAAKGSTTSQLTASLAPSKSTNMQITTSGSSQLASSNLSELTSRSNLTSKLETAKSSGLTKSILSSQLQSKNQSNDSLNNYKLKRIYSESEKNNFDSKTGHRLFDDGKIRPEMSRSNSLLSEDDGGHNPHLYSQDDNALFAGIEDEYIPGLDFSNLLYQWNNRSDQNLLERTNNNESNYTNYPEKPHPQSGVTTSSNTPQSRDTSYLDLNKLHASVAPQPIKSRKFNAGKFSYSKLSEYMKLRNPGSLVENKSEATSPNSVSNIAKLQLNKSNNNSRVTLTSADTSKDGEENDDHKSKRRKSSLIDRETGDLNYESILNSLPENFNELPYSQRKRLVTSFSDSIDYSQFSLFAKSYLQENGNSFGSFRTSKSGGSSNNNSFVRRPRCSSVNTIAGRLLQMSSTDLKKLQEKQPVKTNVDEKGAIVMGHELGKVIGFGAWGTIRECTDRHSTVRAIKIVKSVKDDDPSPRSSPNPMAKQNNPKVLEVFRKEIKIWKELHHPNILPLLKSLETETTIFCITNRIYGGTLFDLVSSWGVFNASILNTIGDCGFLIEGQESRLKQVIDCSSQIMDALKYMHDKGIVHGDLKLENVLVENKENGAYKMILCDFGMSKFFNNRITRRSSIKNKTQFDGEEDDDEDDGTLYIRSKSSVTELRKPYDGGDSANTKNLKFDFNDDSKIGISNLEKIHGPSLQSVDLAPTNSWRKNTLLKFREKGESKNDIGIDSDLPHSHIGSLPYAAPELLSPSPPPLGPLADIWALGVSMYTMCVGKLPFQHQYEPRLRAIITAGKYNREELRQACLLEWIYRTKDDGEVDKLPENFLLLSPSMVDVKRKQEMDTILVKWKEFESKSPDKYKYLYESVLGTLDLNITKRWDLQKIKDTLSQFSG